MNQKLARYRKMVGLEGLHSEQMECAALARSRSYTCYKLNGLGDPRTTSNDYDGTGCRQTPDTASCSRQCSVASVAASLRVHRGTTLPNHDHLHFCIVWNFSPAAVSSEACRSVRSVYSLDNPLPRITKLQMQEASLITDRRQNEGWTCQPDLTWN